MSTQDTARTPGARAGTPVTGLLTGLRTKAHARRWTHARALGAKAALCALATLLALPPAASGGVENEAQQSLAAIEAAALRHAKRSYRPLAGAESELSFRVLPIDQRLQLVACDAPLDTRETAARPGSARVAVLVSCPGSHPWRLYVRLEVEALGEVVVAARPLVAGSVLDADDLRLERRNLSRLRGAYAADPAQLTGRSLRRSVRPGEVVPLDGLARELLVHNGEQVNIVSGGDGFSITMRGTALRDGGMGARVKVRNSSSGRIVEGRVVDTRTVQVGPAGNLEIASHP